MNEDASDEQLVARAQAGDPRAFDLLIRKYQHKVIKLTARYVNPADAPETLASLTVPNVGFTFARGQDDGS